MRRVLVVIIATLYLAVSSGFTVHVHYCMSKYVGTELWHPQSDDHACESCGMKKSSEGNGCCKDEHKTVKLEQKHVRGNDVLAPHFAGLLAFSAVPPHSREESTRFTAPHGQRTAMTHGPPGSQHPTCPIYLRVQSFRV